METYKMGLRFLVTYLLTYLLDIHFTFVYKHFLDLIRSTVPR